MLKNEECNESWNCSEGKQEMDERKKSLFQIRDGQVDWLVA